MKLSIGLRFLAILRRISISLQSIDYHLSLLSNTYVSEWEKKNVAKPRKPVEVEHMDLAAIVKDWNEQHGEQNK